MTTYSKVSLTITGVDTDWKTTWGKITRVKYTIKNDEAGTIKLDYAIMIVEGYEDFEKKLLLPSAAKSIKSKTTVSSTLTVPNGYSYSELVAGDLTGVDISLTVYDANGKTVAAYKGPFNLQG